MKIHRVHNYSYDLRLNESLDSRNAEKMLHNRKKRRETVLWNRQYLWATDNNVSGKSSDTWPLYSKGQHLRYNGENMSLFFFVSAQMNARKKIVDAILFCYLVEWAKNYALGWHGYPMFMFRMFQATAKKSDSSFAFFLVVNRVFHHSNRILIHSYNDILFQSFLQIEYHWLYAIRNDFYDFYKYHVS